jgi:flagellar assembly protein FliH
MIRRVISGEAGGGAQRWQAPEVSAPVRPHEGASGAQAHAGDGGGAAPAPPAPERIEQIEREAREQGFRQGLEEGRQAGRDALAREAENLRRVLDSLAPLAQGLDAGFEEELVTLAVTIARQLVRRELRADPGQIVAVVREAIAVLPASQRRIRLHLHPEDAHIVREALHLSELEQPWKIIEDPTLTRGGALLETESSRVDATLESRLNAVIAEVWGGERRGDEDMDTDPPPATPGRGAP